MTKSKSIRILIADDHGLVREGLQTVLDREGFEVVGEATTGREAVAQANALLPDVILLDIRMPDMDGLQALAEIKRNHPQISVVMLTTYANPGYMAKAVNAGAAGYLSKDIDPERIPVAVRAAARGEHLLDRELLRTILGNISSASPAGPAQEISRPIVPLSNREREVLRLIVSGLSNDAIAESLTVSLPTVKTHIRHIFEKLNVSDRTQAAVWAVRHGVE